MKQKLIEFKTSDGLTLNGILITPNKQSKKTIIHVHGLSDNFYEKNFIKVLAKMYIKNNYNYLSFNNRGSGYCSKILKNDKKIMGGSCCELFKDSFFDIDAAIEYALSIKTEEIILEGHSLGCSKIVNYYNEKQHPLIKKLILLAPCDGIMKIKQIMGQSYETYLKIARDEISNKNKNKVLYNSEMFPQTYTAETFANDYVEDSKLDIFRYRDKTYKSEILDKIKMPLLIIIGTNDKMAFISEKDDITPFFKKNLKNDYTIEFITGANHNYENSEFELARIINNWIKK